MAEVQAVPMVVVMDLEVEVGAMVVEDSKNATRKRVE